MRLHVLSLPHTQTTHDYLTCAYTQKVVKFSKMMLNEGHEVFLYSGTRNTAPCTEHIPTIDPDAYFLRDPMEVVPAGFTWDYNEPYWKEMNANIISALALRVQPRDILCTITGLPQQPVRDAFPAITSCEFGVGYEGIVSRFCVFESYAWMHYLYGKWNHGDGRFYDAVIPNAVDPIDFSHGKHQGDYFLYVGRMLSRKGVQIAVEMTKRLGAPLILAGPGGTIDPETGIITAEHLTIDESHVTYVGPIDATQRNQLMGDCHALICPTIYVEPFAGVHVEAMMTGAPVVSTDHGIFTETIMNGVNGYRCRTLADFVYAGENVDGLDTKAIRNRAMQRYSLGPVGKQYTEYFGRLDGLWGEGWYA